MPGWHDVTEPYRQSGQLEVVGLIQEQHPDRAALFMQWKDMDWPLWVDSLNLLELPAVPYTLLINESGRIRYVGPSQEEFLSFMAEPVPQKASPDLFEGLERPDLGWLHRQAKSTQQSSAWLAYAQALYLWHWDTKSASCLDAFEQALASDPGNGWIHFRKGVAHRRLFDQQLLADPIELELAMKHWQKALSLDPDQYIWRRRLQQYGPRLDKPYAFYDWVKEARHALKARGEVPLSLMIEPVGSEIAKPVARDALATITAAGDWAPQMQVERDKARWITWHHVSVASTQSDRESFRIHMSWAPVKQGSMVWNNEAEPLTLYLEASDGWRLSQSTIQVPGPDSAHDQERRWLEFELSGQRDATKPTVSGYALYHVCDPDSGLCLFRRQDFTLSL